MGDVTIRAATAADREWAARVMAGNEPWLTLGRDFEACLASCCNPHDELHVADLAGAPAGFVLVRPQGIAGAPYIVSIAVAEAHRSRGIGHALIGFVADRYRERARHLFLCVSSFNPRARAMYEREGFSQVGLLPDFIIDGHAELLMCRRIRVSGPAVGER